MPNLHIVDPEKGNHGTSTSYAWDAELTTSHDEPFIHGAGTVAEETGRGGDTHRGLKSRHIQFLYVLGLGLCLAHVHPAAHHANPTAGPSAVPLEPDYSSAAVAFLPSSDPRPSSWPISP